MGWGHAGSCLRRNDGRGARGGGECGCALEECGRPLGRWWTLGASHPPPSLPPKRGRDELGNGEVGKVGWRSRGFLPAQE